MIEPDIDGITRRLGRLARRKKVMVVTAESCTGGGAAQAITRASGAAKWFDRGFVTYSNTAKRDLLGVRQRTLANHGAVSEAVAREMAVGALGEGGPGTVSVAITGIAGPTGGSRSKPVGTVWFAWAARKGLVQARCYLFKGNRSQIQAQAIAVALQGLADLLK
jgi:nicotinamide-nucleotide amidase